MADQILHSIDEHIGLQAASLALLSLALIPVAIGSYCSVKLLQNPTPRPVKTVRRPRTRSVSRRLRRGSDEGTGSSSSNSEGEEESAEVARKRDKAKVINYHDTILFPLLASALVYMVSRTTEIIDPSYIDSLMMALTVLLSVTVFSSTMQVVAKAILPSRVIDSIGKFKFSYTQRDQRLCHLNVTVIQLFFVAVSIGLAITYALSQHWVIGDLFAISIAIQAIRFLTLKSFGTGYFLLLGMLGYDLFWVIGTDTLERLSKVLVHAPTSVVWPRMINTYMYDTLLKHEYLFTMFGLGEIIVPGIFIAFCLRVDRLNAWRSKSGKFRKPYFYSTLAVYAAAAATSIYTVHYTKQSQSAFLYVAPSLIITTIVVAAIRGELYAIWDLQEVLDTFKEINGYATEEYRPTREERMYGGPRRAGRSVSASVRRAASEMEENTAGVVEEVFEETRKAVGPYFEEAAGAASEVTLNAMEETKKAVAPYVEEAIKSTKRAVNAVATRVQEQTELFEDTTIEQDVVAAHAKKTRGRSSSRGRRGRGRGRGRSTSVARRKKSDSTNK